MSTLGNATITHCRPEKEIQINNSHIKARRQLKSSNQLPFPQRDGCKTRYDIKYFIKRCMHNCIQNKIFTTPFINCWAISYNMVYIAVRQEDKRIDNTVVEGKCELETKPDVYGLSPI